MAALTFDHIEGPQQQGAPQRGGPLTFDHIPTPGVETPGNPLVINVTPSSRPAAEQIPTATEQPWYAQAGQAADDLARLAANSMTFGYADKLAGYLGGEGTAAERARTEQARERAGSAGTATELGAGLVGPLAVSRAGLSLAGNVPRAVNNLLTRSAAAGVEGAGWGALSAAGHDQDLATGAGLGAAAGAVGQPIGEALSTAVGGVAGLFNRRTPLPSAAETKALGGKAYEAAERAGVIVKPSFVSGLASDIRSTLANEGYTPNLHPNVAAGLQEIESKAGQNVTLKGLDVMRRVAGNVADNADPSTSRLGRLMVGKIDQAVDKMDMSHVLTGNKTEGVQALQEARTLWRQGRMAETVDKLLDNAELNVANGGSLDRAISNQFKSFLKSSEARFLKPDERAAFRNVVEGDSFQKILRGIGGLAPTSGKLQALANLAAGYASGGVSVAGTGVAMGAKAIGDRATQNNVYALARIIANNGTAPPAIQNAVQRLAASERETLGRILTNWGIQGGQETGAGAALP